jgi:hypothetical protein
MNYFNYFTEVENEFVKRRGSHLLVSPLDWSLIESWKQRGVPLHIVLRGINSSFDGYDKHAHRGRRVNTLFFCQQEIEALYLEYCESRVGSSDLKPGENGAVKVQAGNGHNGHGHNGHSNGHGHNGHGNGHGNGQPAEPAPFAKARVIEFLSEHRTELAALSRQHQSDWPLAETFTRTAARLQQLSDELQTGAYVDSEALERDLTVIEELILDALKQSISAELLAEYETEAKRRLRSYKDKMGKEVYGQTLGNYLGRRLREHFQVPRLSLFYL